MIQRPTVLVLGAGASAPYGFPVGSQLRDLILARDDRLDEFAFTGIPAPEDEAEGFRRAFRHATVDSIDVFLANRKGAFLRAGKRLIAAHIARCECHDRLFPSTDDWMKKLFDIMRSDKPSFKNNQLTVVTFNYDRSFELKLYWHLRDYYRFEWPEAIQLVNQWPIYHVHGSLGECFFPDMGSGYGRPYAPNLDWLSDIETKLFLVHDELQAHGELTKVQEAIANADRVIFLGFGFHELNCRRLFTNKRPEISHWLSTRLGMTDAECNNARNLLPPAVIGNRIDFGDPSWDAYRFLRERIDVLQS
ncbi:MAG: hypothetical protein IT443_04000 [Phycisphaeraceae bacterium]|nr:hypothetical protein [Phycisphaeraceae bacterium]